jgi:hypothetical protein
MSKVILPKTDGGSFMTGAEHTPFLNQVESVITDAGGSLVLSDDIQFRQAINSYASISSFYIDSGLANAYVLNPQGAFKTPIDAPLSWNGMLIRFRATNTNTGIATVSLAGLGGGTPINILNEDGTVLTGGEIATTRDTFLRYNITLNAFLVLNSGLWKAVATIPTQNFSNVTRTIILGPVINTVQTQQEIIKFYNNAGNLVWKRITGLEGTNIVAGANRVITYAEAFTTSIDNFIGISVQGTTPDNGILFPQTLIGANALTQFTLTHFDADSTLNVYRWVASGV